MDKARHRRNLIMAAVVILMLSGFVAVGIYQDITSGVSSFPPKTSKTRITAKVSEDFGLYCLFVGCHLIYLGAGLSGAIVLLRAARRKED